MNIRPAEHPLILDADMIAAILDRRKTTVRLPIEWDFFNGGCAMRAHRYYLGEYSTGNPASGRVLYSRRGDMVWEPRTRPAHFPLGKVGDVLLAHRELGDGETFIVGLEKARLLITDIYVQRLMQITEGEARAEGVTPLDFIGDDQQLPHDPLSRSHASHPHTLAFGVAWDEAHFDRGFGWKTNPWVWVVEFEVLTETLEPR